MAKTAILTAVRPEPCPGAQSAPQVCRACVARHHGICGALTDVELKELSRVTTRRHHEAGVELHAMGEEPASFANVLQGVVKLSKMLPDGRQQIVGLQFPPDFLGRPFGRESPLAAETATAVELCTIPRAALERMLERFPGMQQRLLNQTLVELDDAREWLLALGRKTARERVASLLLMIARHVPGETIEVAAQRRSVSFELPLTRADMADFLGLTLETVSRQLTRLKRDGLISISGTRQISVPDLDRLAASCEG